MTLLEARFGRDIRDLTAAELMVVGAFRAWVADRARPAPRSPDWRAILAMGGIAAHGATALEIFLGLLADTATRPIEAYACGCARIGADEQRLVALVALIQAGEWCAAAGSLRDWLPGSAMPTALRALECFAFALTERGHCLHARRCEREPWLGRHVQELRRH